MPTYELKLASGRVVEWDGDTPEEAAQRYVAEHRTEAVVAWRDAGQHGIFPFVAPIYELDPLTGRWGTWPIRTRWR